MRTYIEELIGKTFVSVREESNDNEDSIIFEADTGEVYKMYHKQECCEGVSLGSITGDLSDLEGVQMLQATEDTVEQILEYERGNHDGRSETWTFYNFATEKGYVALRWYGTSKGYYSEKVSIEKIQ
jgi:hypothetical protein